MDNGSVTAEIELVIPKSRKLDMDNAKATEMIARIIHLGRWPPSLHGKRVPCRVAPHGSDPIDRSVQLGVRPTMGNAVFLTIPTSLVGMKKQSKCSVVLGCEIPFSALSITIDDVYQGIKTGIDAYMKEGKEEKPVATRVHGRDKILGSSNRGATIDALLADEKQVDDFLSTIALNTDEKLGYMPAESGYDILRRDCHLRGMDNTGLARIIGALVDRKLVVRKRDGGLQRVIGFQLSAEGCERVKWHYPGTDCAKSNGSAPSPVAVVSVGSNGSKPAAIAAATRIPVQVPSQPAVAIAPALPEPSVVKSGPVAAVPTDLQEAIDALCRELDSISEVRRKLVSIRDDVSRVQAIAQRSQQALRRLVDEVPTGGDSARLLGWFARLDVCKEKFTKELSAITTDVDLLLQESFRIVPDDASKIKEAESPVNEAVRCLDARVNFLKTQIQTLENANSILQGLGGGTVLSQRKLAEDSGIHNP